MDDERDHAPDQGGQQRDDEDRRGRGQAGHDGGPHGGSHPTALPPWTDDDYGSDEEESPDDGDQAG